MFAKSVGVRIGGIIGLLVCLILVLAAIGGVGISRQNDRFADVLDVTEQLTALQQMRFGMAAIRTELLLTLQHDPSSSFANMHDHPTQMHIDRVAANRERVEKFWQEFRAVPVADEDRALFEQMERTYVAFFREGVDPVMAHFQKGEFAQGNLVYLRRINPIFEENSQVVQQIRNRISDRHQAAKIATEADGQRGMVIFTSFAVFAVLVGSVLGWLVYRSVARPLADLNNTLVRVEQTGDLSLRARIFRLDEVGRTAAAFDAMMDKISSLVSDARSSATSIAAAVEDMANASMQVERSSAAQSDAAASVAATVEETSVSISETAAHAQIADETASNARREIEKTLVAVRETSNEVTRLAAIIADASQNVSSLADRSRQIDGIVQTIKDIADQTNLLALNAAIEAARAGEQGRGFAVVADEVRKLAEKTTVATGEISSLISGVQSEVDASVTRMRDANAKAEDTRERVLASSGALDAAIGNTKQVTEAMRSIASAVREQDVAARLMAERIEQIAQMSGNNSAAAQEAAQAAGELDRLAQRLQEAVGRFRV